jgi:hypothetical protein
MRIGDLSSYTEFGMDLFELLGFIIAVFGLL